MRHDLRPFIEQVERIVAAHRLETPGHYRRWLWAGEGPRDMGLNAYGVADAANLLYTIGTFPTTTTERDGFQQAFAQLQDVDTGLFREGTHHPPLAPRPRSTAVHLSFPARAILGGHASRADNSGRCTKTFNLARFSCR